MIQVNEFLIHNFYYTPQRPIWNKICSCFPPLPLKRSKHWVSESHLLDSTKLYLFLLSNYQSNVSSSPLHL